MKKTLNDLTVGQISTIVEIEDIDMCLRLITMGCVPGDTITIKFISPLGCPIAFSVNDSILCIRREEANNIIVE